MNPIICPTITAETIEQFKEQTAKVAPFAHRIQIDLTDGAFAEHKTVEPAEIFWPVGVKADIHLMYQEPGAAAKEVLRHKPNLVIVHAEASGDFAKIAGLCREAGVKAGVALLPRTPAETLDGSLDQIDHVLIFSGNLGYQGGSRADLSLLAKASYLKKQKPTLEIGWDGGVNIQNIAQLVFGGIDVINVGGFIQTADNPEKAYQGLERIAEETGTT